MSWYEKVPGLLNGIAASDISHDTNNKPNRVEDPCYPQRSSESLVIVRENSGVEE